MFPYRPYCSSDTYLLTLLFPCSALSVRADIILTMFHLRMIALWNLLSVQNTLHILYSIGQRLDHSKGYEKQTCDWVHYVERYLAPFISNTTQCSLYSRSTPVRFTRTTQQLKVWEQHHRATKAFIQVIWPCQKGVVAEAVSCHLASISNSFRCHDGITSSFQESPQVGLYCNFTPE